MSTDEATETVNEEMTGVEANHPGDAQIVEDAEATGESVPDDAGISDPGSESSGENPSDSEVQEESGEAGTPEEGDEDGEVQGVHRAEFQPLAAREGSATVDNMQLLMDVTVPVAIELGSAEMSLREILDLGPGSVMKLDRRVGDPVDILVNGELVGRGEVVVVDDQFGIRVMELLGPETVSRT